MAKGLDTAAEPLRVVEPVKAVEPAGAARPAQAFEPLKALERDRAVGPTKALEPVTGSALPQASAGPAGMVRIPKGEFWMGSDDGTEGERPLRRVTLSADFWLEEREVTVADYEKCVRQGNCRRQNGQFWGGELDDENSVACNAGKRDRMDHPMNCVDLTQADAYCRWAGKQLPTEAQWERAARGGVERQKYVWGDAWPPPNGAGNFGDATTGAEFSQWPGIPGYNDGYATTAPGCKFTRNGYGLCDMDGNVSEWVADTYEGRGYMNSRTRKASPLRYNKHTIWVYRGGSWLASDADYLRVACLGADEPKARSINVGFRCAKSL